MPSGQPVAKYSRDGNAYEYDRAPSGYIGPNPNSGLIYNDALMHLANEFAGIEKVTTFTVQGNVIQSESGVYYRYDANVGN